MAKILDEVLPTFREMVIIPRTTSQDLNEKEDLTCLLHICTKRLSTEKL